MRIIVCGSRKYGYVDEEMTPEEMLAGIQDKWFLRNVLSGMKDQYTVIIQGEATGADALAKEWARINKIHCEGYRADWNAFKRAAGPIRNKLMIDEGHPDMVLAFTNDLTTSKGTANMVRLAKKAGLPTFVLGRKLSD